jgi:hypothetical protein
VGISWKFDQHASAGRPLVKAVKQTDTDLNFPLLVKQARERFKH